MITIILLSILGCLSMMMQDSSGTLLNIAENRNRSTLAGGMDVMGDAAKFLMLAYSGTLLMTAHGWMGRLFILPILVTGFFTTQAMTKWAGTHIHDSRLEKLERELKALEDRVRESTEPSGDLSLLPQSKVLGKAIRWAERLRRDGAASGAAFNHVAWLDHLDRSARWVVGQATAHGVTCNTTLDELLSKNTGVLVAYPDEVNQKEMLEFLRAQIGARYGFLTIISIFLTLFTPRFVNIMLPDTWICSAVVAEGLRAGGWVHNWPDIYTVSPANLYLAIKDR